MKVLVLISGRGTNLEALLQAIDDGRCAANVVSVLSDRDAAGLEHARRRDVPTRVVAFRKDDRDAWAGELLAAIDACTPQLIVLAGFMRVLDPRIIARYAGRILNVHPSLLPAFPGLHATRRAIEAGVRVSGCTVHVVDEGVDTGRVLAQAAVAVAPDDDAASLQARIQRAEHRLLPAVVDAVARGRVDPTTGAWRGVVAPDSFFSFPLVEP